MFDSRRWARRAAVLLMMTFGVVAGCDDDEASSISPLTGPVPEARAGQEMSTRLCAAYRQCGCGELAGVDLSQCDLGMSYAWQAISEDAAEQGLEYDGDCMTRRLNAMLERGCETYDAQSVNLACAGETCLVYHGDVAEGGECDGGASISECQQGLICFGTCEKPCYGAYVLPAIGDPCVDEEGRAGACETGALCDVDAGVCAAPPAAGLPCILGQCADGHWCDVFSGGAPGRCQLLTSEGGACTVPNACESLVCNPDGCGPSPSEGETCAGVCSGELLCLYDAAEGSQICTALPKKGSPCLSGVLERCASGLACRGEVCADAPTEGRSCVDETMGSLMPCAGDLICGGAMCSLKPSSEGCDVCDDPDGNCVVQVCTRKPPMVCADGGGLLY